MRGPVPRDAVLTPNTSPPLQFLVRGRRLFQPLLLETVLRPAFQGGVGGGSRCALARTLSLSPRPPVALGYIPPSHAAGAHGLSSRGGLGPKRCSEGDAW